MSSRTPVSPVLAAWARELLVNGPGAAEATTLLAELELDGALLTDREARIPHAAMCALWSRLTEEHPDPLFGIHFAERAPPASLGIAGYLAASCETVGQAVQRVGRYHRLIKTESGLELRQLADGALAIIELPPAGGPPWPRHLAEAIIASYLAGARRLCGASVRPRSVSFQHGRPARAADEHADWFGRSPSWTAATNALVLEPEDLARPVTTRDADLAAHLERLARIALAELAPAGSIRVDLRRAIQGSLGSGQTSLLPVARRLGLGTRTLQRRLREENLVFGAVVDDVRREAFAELRRQRRTLSEIAFMLGFSDTSGFRRARQRWSRPRAD